MKECGLRRRLKPHLANRNINTSVHVGSLKMVEDETVPLSHRTSYRPHLGRSPILDYRLGGEEMNVRRGMGVRIWGRISGNWKPTVLRETACSSD